MKKHYTLVFGARGFIGSNLLHAIANDTQEIWYLDRKDNFLKCHNYNKQYKALTDIKDYYWDNIYYLSDNVREFKMQIVSDFVETKSYQNFLNFLKLLTVTDFKRLIYFSSGGALSNICKEGVLPAASESDKWNMYVNYKVFTENSIANFFNQTKGQYIIIRPSNVYGYYPDKKSTSHNVINHFAKNILDTGKINVTVNRESSFDFLHICDLVSAVQNLHNDPFAEGIYNISSNQNTSMKKLVHIFNKYSPSEFSVNWCDDTMQIVKNSIHSSKLSKRYNWRPRYSIDMGIREIFQHDKEWHADT